MNSDSDAKRSHASRITLVELARIAGVHHTTVSRALRNHPGIPEATRLRIKHLAETEGYRPDPFLSALASYRKNVQGVRYQATLAWVLPFASRSVLETHPIIPEYLRGVKRRATELGFGVDEVWLKDFTGRSRGISSMLKARGIVGLFIPPQIKPNMHLHLEWENFVAVSFGFTLTKPVLNRVANDQYCSVFKLTRHLLALGFKRPCLTIVAAKDERVRYAWSAGFRSAMESAGCWNERSVYKPVQYRVNDLIKWMKKAAPDVLIALDPKDLLPLFKAAGVSIPRDLSLAGVALQADEPYFGGVTENGELMGETAVELLSGMLNRGEMGIPVQPRCTMIEGQYHAGPTIRPPG